MQLSKFTDYSFRALIYLAHKKNSLATVDELANALQISEHHLKKIIHKLAKTNYVISIKGRGGGLKLGIEPEHINLGTILMITEDNLNIVECFNNPENCPLMTGDCKLKNIVSNSLQSFIKEFSKYSLKDIL